MCSLWAGEETSFLGFTDILRLRLVTNVNMVIESRKRTCVYLCHLGGEGEPKLSYEKEMKTLGMSTLETRKFKMGI